MIMQHTAAAETNPPKVSHMVAQKSMSAVQNEIRNARIITTQYLQPTELRERCCRPETAAAVAHTTCAEHHTSVVSSVPPYPMPRLPTFTYAAVVAVTQLIA
jgi:hypothetical protein